MEYIQCLEVSFFFLVMIGNSISGETSINIQHSTDVDSVPQNSYLRLTCDVTRPPATVAYFWEKTQDVSVTIYFSNNSNFIYRDSSTRISVAELTEGNQTSVTLTLGPFHTIDAGVYTCGYINTVNTSINGSVSTPLVSVSQVGSPNVSLTAITDEVDGVFHFAGPSEVSCHTASLGVGKRIKVEIGSRDITHEFSLHTSPMEWRGTTDGFKSQVQEMQLRKGDFFPPRNDTLVCTVFDQYEPDYARDSLIVTGNPEYAVPVSLKCSDIHQGGERPDTECTVFYVDIGDVVEFRWLVEVTPGRFTILVAPSPQGDFVISHSFTAFPAQNGTPNSDRQLTYVLLADATFPVMTRRPTVEARVFTTNAGNASFILGDQVMAEPTTTDTAPRQSTARNIENTWLLDIPISATDQTDVVVGKIPDMETYPVGYDLTLICNIFRPPVASTLYWEKIQDVTVPIYLSYNGNVTYDGSSPNIRVVERTFENVIQMILAFGPIRGIDAGIYRCGYASTDDISLYGSKSIPILSISNVHFGHVSLTAITDEVDGVYHFSGPSEVLCRATLYGVGKRVSVEIAGRNTTYDFSVRSLPFEWRGSTDGFKSRVQEIQLQKRDYFPPRNGTLVCTVHEGPFNTDIESETLKVTGNPGHAVPVSLTCYYYFQENLGKMIIACNVFNVDIRDVVDFHWLIEDAPGHNVTLVPPTYGSGITQVESSPFLAFQAIYVRDFLHTAGLTYYLQVDESLPFVIGRATVEARVITANAGKASFILGDPVMAEHTSPPTAPTPSMTSHTEIISPDLLTSTEGELSTPPTASTSSAENYTEITSGDHLSSATADGVENTQTISTTNAVITDAVRSTQASRPPDVLSDYANMTLNGGLPDVRRNFTNVTLVGQNGGDNPALSFTICALFAALIWIL